jgi:hypothetical protein
MVLNYNFISSFYATNPICRSQMVQGDTVVTFCFSFLLEPGSAGQQPYYRVGFHRGTCI